MNRKPEFSILIPAYNNSVGVSRILNFVAECNYSGVEIIISDDSTNYDVFRVVNQHAICERVTYIRNTPRLGAIQNWNRLIKLSRGEYVLIMHHDECPDSLMFFNELKRFSARRIDGIFLNCYKQIPSLGLMRCFFPVFLKRIGIKYFPSYLLRRNFIGSPSLIVVRRERLLPFNEKIPMMVDVDWFYRLIMQPYFSVVVSDIIVVTYPNKSSITASFGNDVDYFHRIDAETLKSETPIKRVLLLIAPNTLIEKFISYGEIVIWTLFRLCITLNNCLYIRRCNRI